MSHTDSQFAKAVRAIAEQVFLLETSHPSADEINDFRTGKLSTQKRSLLEHHLALCRACTDLVLETSEVGVRQSPNKEQEPPQCDDVDLKIMIQQLRHSSLSYANEIATRLEFLVDVAQEEQPEGLAISADSLRNFVKFLNGEIKLKKPKVFLTPSGNFRAKWREASNRHLGVEFLPSGDVRFVVFAADPAHSDRTARNSGIVSSEALIQTLHPYKVSMWVFENER